MSSKSVDTEKPERSRNAKAQARHRAKRKAYIEEAQTVTKLQTALGQFTFEQAAVLPPPLAKIRELEAENARLMRENHDLHRMLHARDHGHAQGYNLPPRSSSRTRTRPSTSMGMRTSTTAGAHTWRASVDRARGRSGVGAPL
ncbi:hypothetical protein B0H13DRAFT_1619000 [Mycena leptocephala]|nr:hypothetical protein B0H13DRAFT_1619000 [Mycena leptocephala]